MSSPVYRRVLLSVAVAICIVATIIGFQSRVRPAAAETFFISSSERRPAQEPTRSGRAKGSQDLDVVPDAELDGWLRQAGRDTPGTLAKVVVITDSSRRRELLEWILAAWTAEDRDPALDWLSRTLVSLPEEAAGEAVEILIGAWAAEEPLDAMDWVKQSVPAHMQNLGFATIAETWAHLAPEAMGDWILEQESPPDVWARELVQALIPSDPPRALK